jgi:hypothetical protein
VGVSLRIFALNRSRIDPDRYTKSWIFAKPGFYLWLPTLKIAISSRRDLVVLRRRLALLADLQEDINRNMATTILNSIGF